MSTTQTSAQIAARALVSIAAWPNLERRTGVNPRTNNEFNDGHMNVKVQLNTVKLASILSEALTKGELSIEVHGSLWTNDDLNDGKPCLTGNAQTTRAMIEAKKLAKALDDAKIAAAAAANLVPPVEDIKDGTHG